MAQIGSFVPADEARIGVVDRIFTRVGAHDDLARGQSTFMVEMNETANILNNATGRSLVVLDEIGRGTSTYDGLSHRLGGRGAHHSEIGAKTLFATHYHELNDLEKSLPGVQELPIAVKEESDRIVFLRKIVPGGTDRSYGIQVARLAGLPAGGHRAREGDSLGPRRATGHRRGSLAGRRRSRRRRSGSSSPLRGRAASGTRGTPAARHQRHDTDRGAHGPLRSAEKAEGVTRVEGTAETPGTPRLPG